MYSKRLLFVGLFLLMLLLVGFENGSANNRRILSVTPDEAAANGEIYVRGSGFSPAVIYETQLEPARGGAVVPIGNIRSDVRGEVRGSVVLPDVAAGEYAFQLLDGAVVAGEAALTVVSGPELSLSPTSGPPGTEVTVTVTGLQPGMVQIDYAGVAVLGPVPVERGSFSGQFVVPRDRPQNLGDVVTVEAVNSNGRVIMGTAAVSFTSQAEQPRVRYALENVRLPEEQVRPGTLFPISGRIDPPPTGDLDRYAVTVVWRSADDLIVPITASETQLQANGDFEVMATVPSFLAGDALSVNTGEIGIFVSELAQRTSTEAEVRVVHESKFVESPNLYPQPEDVTIEFLVTDPEGNPIEEALVFLELSGGLMPSEEEEEEEGMMWQNASVGDVLYNPEPNQVNYVYQEAASLSDPNATFKGMIEGYNPLSACGVSALRGFTDETGRFELTLKRDYIYFLINGTHIDATAGGQINIEKVDLGDLLVTVYVNALRQGFGPVENGEPVATKYVMQFTSDDEFWEYDTEAEEPVKFLGKAPTLQFALPPLGDIPLEIPIAISSSQIGDGKDISTSFEGTEIDIPELDFYQFNPFITFPGNQFDPYFAGALKPLTIGFSYNAAVYGLIDEARVYLDDQLVGTINTGVDCGTDVGFAQSLDVGRLSTGVHSGRIELDQIGETTTHYFTLTTEPPPDWFLDPSKYKNQTIKYAPEVIQIYAEDVPAKTEINVPDVDYMGDIDNNTEGVGSVRETIYIGGNRNYTKKSGSDSLVANNDTEDAEQEVKGSAVTGDGNQYVSRWSPISGRAVNGQSFGETITIMDTGMIPIFRYGWGIWPLAEATVGADMWFKAELTHEGTIEFESEPLTTVTMTPRVEAGIRLFLDVSVLFDVFEARLEALPSITIETPVKLVNNKPQGVEDCFKFELDALYYAKVGWCPFCLEAEEVVEMIDETAGSCSAADLKRTPNLTNMTPIVVPSSPPSLAADGYGHTSLVYVDQTGTLNWVPDITNSDNPPIQLTDIPGVNAPVVAYYDQGKAVQLMVINALSLQEFGFATFEEGVANQHIAYRLTEEANGTETASELQFLTQPTTGEGGIQVAGCMAGNPDCPESGEVTAVWTRDVAADLGQRQFRLYYATFSDGVWTTPQPVDPTSTATDTQATVTYVDGVPVVAWVRNPTRSLAQLGERQFAYRFLDGSSPVVTPAGFPQGIASPSMAADSQGNLKVAFTVAENPEESFLGNRRTLHTAVGSCTGSSCTWDVQKLHDARGRDIRVERPQIVIDEEDRATLRMRVIGLGEPDSGPRYVAGVDPAGVYQGTGEAAEVEAQFAEVAHHLIYLSNNVDVEWNPTAVFDPAANVILTAHVEVDPNPVAFQRDTQEVEAITSPLVTNSRMVDESAGIVMTMVPRLPEFGITAVDPATIYPQTGELFDVTVRLNNAGVEWAAGEGDPLEIVATWDGSYGLGEVAGTVSLDGIDTGESISVTLPVSASVDMDGEHQLYLAVNPTQAIAEGNGTNNAQQITVGGIPGPDEIVVSGEAGESLVFLNWEAVDDPRIVGYRIYRAVGDDPLETIGSSLTNGYVDLKAFLDVDYRYAVSAYTATGAESALSETVFVSLQSISEQSKIYLPLVIR